MDLFKKIAPARKIIKELSSISNAVPQTLRETIRLRAFGLMKVPVLFFLSPTVVELTDHRSVVKIPLTRRSRNHLNSMYFGSLAAGADCAGGLLAVHLMDVLAKGRKISLIFKDFTANFLKRAEGDVLFICENGEQVRDCILKTLETGERQNVTLSLIATVPEKLGDEPVAEFKLTLSLKAQS